MELTAIALWLNTAFAGFDEAIAVGVHSLYTGAGWLFTPLLTFISILGDGGACLIIFSACLIPFKKYRKLGTAMLLGLGIGALLTNLWLKPAVFRPRPYTWDGSVFQQIWITMGQHMESDFSFPSGHTTAAMAASTGCFLAGKRRISWTAFFFAIVMGISRIYLGVHYASDVLGGFFAGGIGGVVGYVITLYLPRKYYEFNTPRKLNFSRKKGKHER